MDSGKVFDNSVSYKHSMSESMKLVGSYFTDKEIKNKIVLDAGCRLGYNSCAFVLKKCRLVIGVDLSKKCIRAASLNFQKCKNMKFYYGDMKKALGEFVRVVKSGGTILVTFQKEKNFL